MLSGAQKNQGYDTKCCKDISYMHYLSQFAKYTMNFTCTLGLGVLVEANRTENTTNLTRAYPKHVTNVTCIHSYMYIYYSGSEAMNALAVLSPSKTEQKDIKNYSREKFRDAVFAYMEIKFRDYTHDFIQLPQN